MSAQAPTVGRVVYYAAFGTPGGEYKAGALRAAIVTQVNTDGTIGLFIINPTGVFFNVAVKQDQEGRSAGTWHWMPYQVSVSKGEIAPVLHAPVTPL